MGVVRRVQMGFRGSYSALWSPASFWEAEAPLHARKLRLYMLPSSAQVPLQGPCQQGRLRSCRALAKTP